MGKISIKGVIVPSMWDCDFMEEDIVNGNITPLSRVEKAIAALPKSEPMEVYINSPGGSVFAGHEMLNAMVAWRNETKQAVSITVGAMSASAASTIATLLGPVKAHENAMFMFHGAQSCNCGGRDSMSDMAILLGKINGQVASTLVGRYGIDPDTATEWFSEGRMGWLDANEAHAAGLVSEIIPAAAEVIDFQQMDVDRLQQCGLAVAAMIEIQPEKEGELEMNILAKIAETLGLKPEQATDESAVLQAMETQLAELTAKCDAAYEEGEASGKTAGETEAKAAMQTQVNEITGKLTAAETENAELASKVEQMTGEADKMKQRLSKIDKGFGGDNDTGDAGAAEQFFGAVADLVAAGFSKDAAMIKVQKDNPELHARMIAETNKGR